MPCTTEIPSRAEFPDKPRMMYLHAPRPEASSPPRCHIADQHGHTHTHTRTHELSEARDGKTRYRSGNSTFLPTHIRYMYGLIPSRGTRVAYDTSLTPPHTLGALAAEVNAVSMFLFVKKTPFQHRRTSNFAGHPLIIQSNPIQPPDDDALSRHGTAHPGTGHASRTTGGALSTQS